MGLEPGPEATQFEEEATRVELTPEPADFIEDATTIVLTPDAAPSGEPGTPPYETARQGLEGHLATFISSVTSDAAAWTWARRRSPSCWSRRAASSTDTSHAKPPARTRRAASAA